MPLIHVPSSLGGFPFLPAAAAAAYTCDAADFDGTNDALNRGADFTGAADSSQFILSFWFRIDGGDGVNMRLLRGASSGFDLMRQTTNVFRFDIYDNADVTELVRMDTVGTYTTSATWRHFLASCDTNFTAGNKLTHMYITDVSDKNLIVDSALGNTINLTHTEWRISENFFNGALAEFYFAPGQYLDFSVEANRRKFISATGKPVDLGADGSTPTGATPILYLRMADGAAASTFGTNLASGGGMTITGALDTASTSPSD